MITNNSCRRQGAAIKNLNIGAQTVNRRVYESLSELIFDGTLSMGEKLDERQLSEEMGISRTPLREALAQLVSDGVVERRPYQGNFVRTFSKKQIHDLYEVRKNLEVLAVHLAAPNLPGKGLRLLAETVSDCRQALEAKDMMEFEKTDRDFHETILHFADNETLLAGLKRLDLHIQLIRHIANKEQDLPENSMIEREAILDALSSGDADGAAEGMRQHIQRVQEAALAVF